MRKYENYYQNRYCHRKGAIEEAKRQVEMFTEDKEFDIEDIISLIKKAGIAKIAEKGIFSVSTNNKSEFKEMFKDNFKDLSLKSEKYYYVWIALKEENFAVVVGRTSFSQNARSYFGDLFMSYSIWGISITQHLILNTITTDKEKQILKSLDVRLNEYIQKSIIIPIDVNDNQEANRIEKQIGKFLVDSKVAILNRDSHEK